MQRLNKSITHAVDRPVKVMQFGEGNFLRAFVDYIFDVTNEKTDFNGGVVQLQLLRIMTSTLSMVQARLLDSSFLIQQRLVSYLTRQITILMHVLLRHTQESLHSSFTRDIRSSTEQQIRDLSYFHVSLSLIMVLN